MKKLLWVGTVMALPFLSIIAINILKIPILKEKDCLIVAGVVTEMYEAGDKDVVIKLREQKNTFYVNRGLQQGLDIQKLKEDLLNKQILIKYSKHFTGAGHISKLEAAGRVVYKELRVVYKELID